MVELAPSTITVPPLWCVRPPAIHPRWRELDGASLAWVERTGLERSSRGLAELARIGAGELAARAYPNADFERLRWATDVSFFLFCFDDAYCDEGEARADPGRVVPIVNKLTYLAEAPDAGVFTDDPFCVALPDLCLRLARFTSPGRLARWRHVIAGYLHRQALHAAYRQAGVFPSVDEFFVARLDTSGSTILAAQNDVLDGFELSEAEYERPAVRVLTRSSAALACLTNDLFSHDKECEPRSVLNHNLVDIWAASGLPAEAAVTRVVAEYEQVTRLHVALTERLLPDAGDELRRYLANLLTWPRANHDWSTGSARYGALLATPPAGLATDRPWATATAEPSSIAAIRWWWDLLG